MASKLSGIAMRNQSLDSGTKLTVASIIGGLASKASGGDFYQGAINAMFVYLYNERMTKEELESLRQIVNGNVIRNEQTKAVWKENRIRLKEDAKKGLIKGLKHTRTISSVATYASAATGQPEAVVVFYAVRQFSDGLISLLGGQDEYALHRHMFIDVATQPLSATAPFPVFLIRAYTKTMGDINAK
jgi:hypothetical protein